ncbi:MAG: ribbon-helix-helix protein, CopG family [Cyanothece sp. SIO1E1]|nr:ribbon-helix-helix protein, CopG family [Cyanothece sp. SIO1E1]
MEQPLAHARIPYAWKRQIQTIAQEKGSTESEIVREAIAQYLEQTDPESVAAMSRRLAKLERQYSKLAKLV